MPGRPPPDWNVGPKPKNAKKSGEPGWMWRRWIIFPVVVFACYQLDSLRNASDTKVAEALVYTWGLLVAALVLGYAGFATFQDIAAIWRTGSGLPYAAPPVAIDGDPVPPYAPGGIYATQPPPDYPPPPRYAG